MVPRTRTFNGKKYRVEIGGYASKGRAKEVAREDYRSKGHAARVVSKTTYHNKSVPYTWTNQRTGEKRKGTKTVKVPEVTHYVYYRENKKSNKK